MVINCTNEAKYIKDKIKEKVDNLVANGKRRPSFVIFQVGDNEASNRYVRGKLKDCEYVGIDAKLVKLPEDICQEHLEDMIMAEEIGVDAAILQLPIPSHLNKEKAINCIAPHKDVDGLTSLSNFTSCTSLGVMHILKSIFGDNGLEGKDIVLFGRSELVGKPLIDLLLDENATVTVRHSKSKKIDKYSTIDNPLRNADIIISAIGKTDVIPENLIKNGCYVIDVGINIVDNKLVGDVEDSPRYWKTPVPNGIGLMTRVMLLENIIKAYEEK